MTAETYDDLKQYVGIKDDFTDDLLNMGYAKGRADGIDECIALFREWQPSLATKVSEFGDMLQQLKEHKWIL